MTASGEVVETVDGAVMRVSDGIRVVVFSCDRDAPVPPAMLLLSMLDDLFDDLPDV
jgi:hypothetical protein